MASAQAAIFERSAVRAALRASSGVALAASAYAAAFAAFYVMTMRFLTVADAAAFNLSLLTSDAYALLFSATLNHRLPPPLYFLALGLTTGGVLLYHSAPSPTAKPVAGSCQTADASSCDPNTIPTTLFESSLA